LPRLITATARSDSASIEPALPATVTVSRVTQTPVAHLNIVSPLVTQHVTFALAICPDCLSPLLDRQTLAKPLSDSL
jgi:hypothetical protein